jgi:uncharacterized protein YqhQ
MSKYTSIGGQALIEGILMKSPEKTALAVRTPEKTIDITYLEQKSLKDKYKILGLPVIRGVVGFAESMIQGYKAMMLSASKSGFAVPISKPLYTKSESAEIISPLNALAQATESAVLPDAVAPHITSTFAIKQSS